MAKTPNETSTQVVKADQPKMPPSNAGTASSVPDSAVERLGAPLVQQTSETESIINAAAVYLYRQARFQPIAQLNPQSLTWQLSEWNVGTLRRFSLTMDAIENRDGIVKSVTGKLKHSLSRRTIEIVKVDGVEKDDPEAEAHQQALKDFYNNLECTNAIDRNVRGGLCTLIEQMMDGQLKKYACHEIVWKPIMTSNGPSLTATFIFVPLWFFENRTGVLRFCGNFAWDGIPLRDGSWCITVGDGIMEAIAVAWMYKTIALRDNLIYSEKHGMPGIVGKTVGATDTPQFKAMAEAVKAVSADFSAVIGTNEDIEAVQFGQQGQLPYPILIEYFDKVISALARGADLSTLSAGHNNEGQGASLQGDESDLIEQHCGQIITETLNHYVDPYVLRWHFGEGVIPKAYAKLNVPKKQDVQADLAIDNALVGFGVQLSRSGTCERYGRAEATDEQIENGDILKPPQQLQAEIQQEFPPPEPAGSGLAGNVKAYRHWGRGELKKAARMYGSQFSSELRPIADKVRSITALANEEDFVAAVRGLRHEIPALAKDAPRTAANAHGLLALCEIVNNPCFNNGN